MLRLYFVRHGQTDYSNKNAFCGAIDAPLNAVGLAMADALGTRYGGEKWSAIYSSPLHRTQQTAAPTAKRAGVTVTLADGLHEIHYGSWEGRPEAEVEHEFPAEFAAWSAHPAHVAPPGGETATQIAARAMPVIDEIARTHTGQVLIVSHKATIRVVLCALLGIDVDLFRVRIAQKVGAVSIVQMKKSGPLLEVLGDTSHLPPELRDAEGT